MKHDEKGAETSAPVKPTYKRVTLTFSGKYADLHEQLLSAAEAEDRDIAQFIVRFLNTHFNTDNQSQDK